MTELEKLVQTWEKYKPTGTPHEHIWNGFIDDAKGVIEREKQALSIANVSHRRELLMACLNKLSELGYNLDFEYDEETCNEVIKAINCG